MKLLGMALLCILVAGAGIARGDWPTDQQSPMLPLFYALWSKYSDDLEAGNAQKVASWYTEDAVLMESGKEDVAGRDGIRKYVEQLIANARISDVDVRPGETEVCGDKVYQFGTFSRTFQAGNNTPTDTSSGRFFCVWTRQQDGSWKISRLMFSTNQLPAAAK